MGDLRRIEKILRRSRVSAILLLILEVLLTTVARGAIVQRPSNLAVSVGGSSYFNCSNDDGGGIDWVFSQNGDPGGSNGFVMTDSSCNIVTGFMGNFRTEKPSSSVCSLIVFNANLQLGGYYACVSVSTYQAILVVADTNSTIRSNVTEVVEGCEDYVFFEMTVKYSGPSPVPPTPPSSIALPPLYPSFKWALKSDPNNTIPSSETVTNTTSSSHIIVTATIPSVPSYVCTLYFNPPKGQPTNCDSSAPSLTFNWETPQINTSYNILNQSSITVTSYNESGICEAKILECHPYAYPPPHDVHWLDVIRNETVHGTRITAEFGGEYICSVNNTIETVTVTYKLNDDSAFTMEKCKGVSEVNATEVTTSNATEVTTSNATEATTTCTADGLPNPSYAWYDQCLIPISMTQQTIAVRASGSYRCVANNSINDRKFSKSVTINITLPGTDPVICRNNLDSPDEDWILLLLLILLVLGLFVLPACVFLPCYGGSKSCRENVNEEFPWIEKALPCMNGKGCECSGGMVLFIFCLVICGIIFVPWILIASHCCRKNSNQSQESRYADNSHNSGANGHPGPPHYEELDWNPQTTQAYDRLSQRHEYVKATGNDDYLEPVEISDECFARSSTFEANNRKQQAKAAYEELQRNKHQTNA